MLHHPQVVDAKEILEIIFFYGKVPISIGVSVLALWRWLRGRQPKRDQIAINVENLTVNIDLGDDQQITVTKQVFDVAMDINARQAMEALTSPLKRPGIDRLEVLNEQNQIIEEITKEDIPSLSLETLEGETLLDNTRPAVLAIIRLSFRPEHKWGFTDGSSRITAPIQDFHFWSKIQNGEISFSKGDQILVALRTRTFRTDEGALKSEHYITEVVRHIPRPTQLSLQ